MIEVEFSTYLFLNELFFSSAEQSGKDEGA